MKFIVADLGCLLGNFCAVFLKLQKPSMIKPILYNKVCGEDD